MKPSRTTRQNFSVRPGEVFRLGEHRLVCGDAADAALIGWLVGKERVQLVLTDPPYGVAYVEGKAGLGKLASPKVIANDHEQSEPEYCDFTRRWVATVKPLLTPRNAVYIFNSDKMLFALRDGMREAGCRFAQLLIWVKSQPVMGRLDYLPQHEVIAYGWVGTHEFKKAKDKSVIFHPKPSKSPLHPTMKPVGLLRRLILNSSDVGGIVYDPFGGSGSTLIACEQTKRRCLMIELDPEYCAVIIARWEKLTGKKAERVT
jgi:DNA modification methylase